MKIQESMENYLETIYMLEKQTGYVRSIDIATALGFSKPSISNAMKKLRTDGYIEMEDRGCIKLTEKGTSLAKDTYERHCVISEILMYFGVTKETALDDACRVEHVISEETFASMKKFLETQKGN
ncbi:metal-dependent transcriptional regulator [Anaerotignum sp. MB30-C6]|uniref:metal-dependent transcriptional regulator n=1 Tax=Anaerotignum sp. MB30-C6 TaxID=3070814 RepID=UPI0027DBA235|nr:metal-dependent transcriptional regulator [Anaerotignum sp. MB30-C6]WMI80832.1 metal-dependent transcriptional regulator [Anaerotignum sp. MB30-C6]